MLSFIDSNKTLVLVILLIMFILQVAVDTSQKREVYLSGEVFSSRYVSHNETIGSRISTLLRYFIGAKDDSPNLNRTEVLLKPSKNTSSVKVKNFKDIDKSSSNIFFIESRCGTRNSSQTFGLDSRFNLRPRQCCSVESAATMNPTRSVYILHTCPLGTDFHLSLPKYARAMLGLSNVFVVPVSMAEALESTPVTKLYRSGQMENSIYPVVHASDILRLAVLWRFGGTYCDMDILFIRSLSELRSNFCGIAGKEYIGNAVLNFEPTGYGHTLLTNMLIRVNANFEGQAWIANGPGLLTKTLLRECKATIKTVWKCQVFTVYNRTVLYPLMYQQHKDFFNPTVGESVVRRLKDSGCVTVHFWNKYTSEYSVQVGSSQAYGLLADEFCPAVFRNCEYTF